jgi:murein DD-endopeptidase MepM/ murein hydrolase activator NlpD
MKVVYLEEEFLMAVNPFVVYVRGLPETPSITEVNTRSGPATSYPIVKKVPVGTGNLRVLEVRPDEQQNHFQGKVYQWFKLELPDGQAGWARDDLLEVSGDGSPFGYGVIQVRTFAFVLTRTPPQAIATPPPMEVTVSTPPPPPVPFTPPPVSISADVQTPVVPTPPPAPVATPPPVTSTSSAAPTAYVNARDGANVRSGPGITFSTVTRINRNTALPILAVQQEAGGPFRWVKVALPTGGEGWMREDTLRFDASAAPLGLTQPDLYPAPMADRWWVRGYDGPDGHWGWDFGARTGEPVLAGPSGGLVIRSAACARCTPDRPSFKHYNIPLSDPTALNDPAWNFGYGHYVIVRYLNEQLPASTRQALVSRGLGGAHLYCMYAHLDSRVVSDGQMAAAGAVIGGCGDTGNSEATHLHLEMRASTNPNDTNWAGMKKNLLDPGLLFYR